MIVFFGPAGAGKSVQGQMLAARNGWRWLSAGQLLRDTHDIELIKDMQTGKLVDTEKVNKLMGQALKRAKNIDRVILDGFPRQLSQAKWLVETQPEHERSIAIVIVLEVPRSELLKRIEVRGRVDDTPEAVDERLKIYRTEIYPILTYLTEQGVNIAHIDGTGTVGQVHDRIMEELEACKLV
ncbi:MAG TPA: nucleoside monophosphate kinase [Candidatus Saccharimonadales bacterium]|nr:nucleoside monophosphate kinase [Candidatus Saccharimonadales bacterium]